MSATAAISRRRLLTIVGATALCGVTASCGKGGDTISGGAVRAPGAGRALFGAYISPADHPVTRPANTAAASDFGRALRINQRYVEFEGVFPAQQEMDSVAARQIPMITWQPSGLRLGDIASGRYDEVLLARAKAIAAMKSPLFVRFAHEMNGTWYSWSSQHPAAAALGNTPEQYIAAWRHIKRTFDAAGARNVSWVWCPNAVDVPGDNDMLDYYPGDSVVDWVGLDVYASDDIRREDPARQTFAALLETAARRLPSGKPLIIAEFGFSGSAAFRAKQFASVPGAVADHSLLRALVYFDRQEFSPSVTPEVQAAARAMAASPRLAGSVGGVAA